MADIEEAIYRRLTENAPLESGGKVYALRAPEGTTAPYVVYFRVSAEPRHAQDGPVELRRHSVQVSCFGPTYRQAREELERVRGLLDGFQGTLEGVEIQACRMTDERWNYEPDTRLVHASADFDIDYHA